MSEGDAQPGRAQLRLHFESEAARSLLDGLLEDSRLYRTSKAYNELLDFVVRLRNFAPFNAMLLQVQKPGLSFAASASDWRERFGRAPKEDARPLLILWPFSPVALMYDVLDTEGEPLPTDVASFYASGPVDEACLAGCLKRLGKQRIECRQGDFGDPKAGAIRVIERSSNPKEHTHYRVSLNRNHTAAVQFSTLAHELGHLSLGHLGPDWKLHVPDRPAADHTQKELEAESVAYVVCARNGVNANSEKYLAALGEQNTTIDHVDVFQVMPAAGQVEALLGLQAHMKFEKPGRRDRQADGGSGRG